MSVIYVYKNIYIYMYHKNMNVVVLLCFFVAGRNVNVCAHDTFFAWKISSCRATVKNALKRFLSVQKSEKYVASNLERTFWDIFLFLDPCAQTQFSRICWKKCPKTCKNIIFGTFCCPNFQKMFEVFIFDWKF